MSFINVVKQTTDTLFTYVVKHAEKFLKSKWEDSAVKDAIKLLKDDSVDVDAAVDFIKELTEKRDENKGLKAIQGLIYKDGYESGELKAHIFEDVPKSFETWSKSRKIAIFSTGSIEAQKLLFSHTTEGDLTSHISKYFDQSVGNKTEPAAYEKIVKELEVKTDEVLFITDNIAEAKAAKTAGLSVVVVTREGNDPLPEESSKNFSITSTFKDITFENPAKRKNAVEETAPTEEQPPAKIAKTEEKPAKTSTNEENSKEDAMEVDNSASETKKEAEKDKQPETTEVVEVEEKIESEPSKTEEVVSEIKETVDKESKTDEIELSVEEKKVVKEEVNVAKIENTEKKEEEIKPMEAKESVEVATEKEEVQVSDKLDASDEKPEVSDSKPELEKEEIKESAEVKPEEPAETKPNDAADDKPTTEEKENNSELANGIEKGEEESKQNGDATEESTSTSSPVEEIKVKKIEEPQDGAPPVSVEV